MSGLELKEKLINVLVRFLFELEIFFLSEWNVGFGRWGVLEVEVGVVGKVNLLEWSGW